MYIFVSLFVFILEFVYYRYMSKFESNSPISTNIMWFGDKGLGLTVMS